MPAIAIDRFERELLDIHAAKEHAPSTLRQVRQVLREFRAVGVERTDQLTSAAIARWKSAHPGRTPVTAASHLRCLRAICARARKEGRLEVNPFDVDRLEGWVRPDAPTARPPRRWSITPDQVRRVLETADREALAGDWTAGRLRAYIWTLLLLGMRPGELQRLEVADVDPRDRTVTIRPKPVPVWGRPDRWWRPKTAGSAATIPLGDRLAAVLAGWIPRTGCRWLFPGLKRRGPWTSGGPGVRPLDHVRALGDRAGVELWQKSGRKSVGTNARGAGLTGLERKGLFRHADLATGELYDEQSVDGLRPAAAKVERYYLGTGS
jgi:integrase